MKLCGVLMFSLIVFGSTNVAGSEDSRVTGRLIRDNNGAVLISDDGVVYRVPVSREFLDRHAGQRVTLMEPAGQLTGSGGQSRIIMADEIIVTAPVEKNGSADAGTKAAEAVQLIIPPLIPPL
jgi:hypothetical protein